MTTNRKRLIWQVPFLTLLIVGTILIIRQQQNMPYQKCSGTIFGTIYNITYQYDEDLQQELVDEMNKVDEALSMAIPAATSPPAPCLSFYRSSIMANPCPMR